MAVLVLANLHSRSETRQTEVKVLTLSTGDSQVLEFLATVVTLVPDTEFNI